MGSNAHKNIWQVKDQSDCSDKMKLCFRLKSLESKAKFTSVINIAFLGAF